MGLYGAFYPSPQSRATYELYATIGLNDGIIQESDEGTRTAQGRNNIEDNNNSPAFVGRIGISPAPAADIGYELNPDHWGHGYATEAVGRIITFAFGEIDLDELAARTVDTNSRSIRMLVRLGFSHPLSIPPGTGKDGRDWPQRSEYHLRRKDWSPVLL